MRAKEKNTEKREGHSKAPGSLLFCAGLLLLGATTVVALLQIDRLWSLGYGLAQCLAVFLMAFGALHAGEKGRLFTAAGVVLLLDSLLRLLLQGAVALGLAGSSETFVWAEFGLILVAACLDILGTGLVLGGCGRLAKEKGHGTGPYALGGFLFALAILLATGVPGLVAIYWADHRTLAMVSIGVAAVLLFFVCMFVASKVRRAFFLTRKRGAEQV